MNIEKYLKRLEDVVPVYNKQRIILWIILWPLKDYRQLSFSMMYMDRKASVKCLVMMEYLIYVSQI